MSISPRVSPVSVPTLAADLYVMVVSGAADPPLPAPLRSDCNCDCDCDCG